MTGRSEPNAWEWSAGTTITAASPSRVRLAAPVLGRAWLVDRELLAETLNWLTSPVGRTPELASRLIDAGVLVSGDTIADSSHGWTPVGRFHRWAVHDTYVDGSDPDGSVRQAVLKNFDDADIELMRQPEARGRTAEKILSPLLTEIVWQASSRLRANRNRVRDAKDASELLFSYGAAHDLIVSDATQQRSYVAWVDTARPGLGSPIDVDAHAVLDAARGSRAVAAILVVGDFERYQRRYRHEKALRGFFVDGGRILGEVGRIAAGSGNTVEVVDDLPPDAIRQLLELPPSLHALGAVLLR